MLLTKLIAKQSGGLADIVNQQRIFGGNVRYVMVDDHPVWFVETLLKGQIRYPGSFLAWFALTPRVVVVSFKGNLSPKLLLCQALQQDTRYQPVQIALV